MIMCLYAGNGKTGGSSPGIALHATLRPTDLRPCVLLSVSGLALSDVMLIELYMHYALFTFMHYAVTMYLYVACTC